MGPLTYDFSVGDTGFELLGTGCVVVSLATLAVERVAEIRDRLRRLLMGKNTRLHWRDESSKRRRTDC